MTTINKHPTLIIALMLTMALAAIMYTTLYADLTRLVKPINATVTVISVDAPQCGDVNVSNSMPIPRTRPSVTPTNGGPTMDYVGPMPPSVMVEVNGRAMMMAMEFERFTSTPSKGYGRRYVTS